MSEHFSSAFEPTDEGWWHPACACGWNGWPCPTAEDACDVLMDHAYAAGLDASSSGCRSDTGTQT